MGRRKANIWERIDFRPDQHRILTGLSDMLGITLAGAVEYAVSFGIISLGLGVIFFKNQIEACPGSRVTREDMLAAFREWCRSYGFEEPISAADFAAMGNMICHFKKITVRVRGNQVVCVDVRLRETPDRGERAARLPTPPSASGSR
jgi:hypothetical protein